MRRLVFHRRPGCASRCNVRAASPLAVTLSLKVAALATLIALVLGTLAAAALWRRDFFGKNAISLLLLLPIALPGIVTGGVINRL